MLELDQAVNGVGVDVMLGMTMASVESDSETVTFLTVDGRLFRLYHEQDCCESVVVEDIDGDLEVLVGAPLLVAEEISNAPRPDGFKPEYEPDSETWTFYKFATEKGHVTIRFHGESNGYYSEEVSFAEVVKP